VASSVGEIWQKVGTLSVSDGTHSASIQLFGQYMAAGFSKPLTPVQARSSLMCRQSIMRWFWQLRINHKFGLRLSKSKCSLSPIILMGASYG